MNQASIAPRPLLLCFATVALFALMVPACGKSEKSAPKTSDEPTAAGSGSAAEPPPAPAAADTPPAEPKALTPDPGGASGKPLWAIGYGGIGTDAARGVAVDGTSIYVGGYFEGESNFGIGPTVTAQKLDGYLLKLDASGKPSWVLTLGAEHEDVVNAVAVKPDGAVVIAGLYAGKIRLGEIDLETAGSDDAFLAQVSSAGKVEWALAVGGTDSDGANHVAVGPHGEIAVTGSFGRWMKIGKTELNAAGGEDMFVCVISAAGEIAWARSFGAYNKDVGERVAFDAQGNLFLLGEFTDTVDFGGGAPLEAVGNRDLALVKLSPTGDTLWAKRFGGSFNELGLGLAIDPAGNLTIAGSFDNEIAIGAETHKSAGESDIFVASFDAQGAPRWSHAYGGSREDIGAGIATDDYGNVLVVGWFWGDIAVSTQARLVSAGNKDGLVLKLSPAGELLWSHRIGGEDHDQGRAVAIDKDGTVIVAGIYRFDVTVGELKLASSRKQGDRAPKSDVFVARFER